MHGRAYYWVECHYRCFTANGRVSQHEGRRQTAGSYNHIYTKWSWSRWCQKGLLANCLRCVWFVTYKRSFWSEWKSKIQIHGFLHVLREFLLCWGVCAPETHNLQPWPKYKAMKRLLLDLVLPHSPHKLTWTNARYIVKSLLHLPVDIKKRWSASTRPTKLIILFWCTYFVEAFKMCTLLKL